MNCNSIILLVSVFIISASDNVFGQKAVTERTLSWRSEEATDKASNAVGGNFILVVKDKEFIELIHDEEPPLHFTIESFEGEWLDEKTDGLIRFRVHFRNEVRGTVTIERSSGLAVVRVDFSEAGPNALDLTLKVSNVN